MSHLMKESEEYKVVIKKTSLIWRLSDNILKHDFDVISPWSVLNKIDRQSNLPGEVGLT